MPQHKNTASHCFRLAVQFLGSVAADFLPHEAHIGNCKCRECESQQSDKMRPDEQKALSQGQVAAQRADQLRIGNRVDGPGRRVHQNRGGLRVQIIRGDPVQVQIQVVVVQ